MSSTIYRDPLNRYIASSLYNDIETIHYMFNDIKGSIDANASDWFPSTVVSTYDDDASGQTLYKLTLYDKDNDPVISFKQGYYIHTGSNPSLYSTGYYIEIVAHASALDVSDQNRAWFGSARYTSRRWFVTKITYNEKFISFSFASDEGNDDLFLQGSSLFLVKTIHNNIAVIRSTVGNSLLAEGGSNTYWGGPINSSFYLDTYPSSKGAPRLSCITKESATSYWDDTTRYGQTTIQESMFVMRPVIVSGVSDDYCIDTFYAASSPFLLANVTDGVMVIGEDEYFTNGIVYVKL